MMPTVVEPPDEPMSFEEYARATSTTARYPAPVGGVPLYAVMGLAGESQEVLEAMMAEDEAAIKNEIGDTFWYIARMFNDVGLAMPQADLNDVKASYELKDERVGATALMIMSGRCCEIVKRWYKRGTREEDEIAKLRDHLMVMVAACVTLADFYDTTLQSIAMDNLDKLKKRYAS